MATVSTFYPDDTWGNTTADGIVLCNACEGTSATFSTVRDSSLGAAVYATAPTTLSDIAAWNVTDRYYRITRMISTYDTSAIGADTISAAISSYYGSGSSSTITGESVVISDATPASNNAFVAADYTVTNWSTTELSASRIATGSWNTSAYNDFTLDASGISNIDGSGITKMGLRMSSDFDNTAPSWASFGSASVAGFYASETGTDKDPKLVVTHVAPGPAFASLNGVATGGIATINGVDITLVASVNAQI